MTFFFLARHVLLESFAYSYNLKLTLSWIQDMHSCLVELSEMAQTLNAQQRLWSPATDFVSRNKP